MICIRSWKKDKNVDGYQIEYSLKKNFKGSKKVTIKKAKTTQTVLRKLTANRKNEIRIRSFKKVKGKTYYSEWSKAKTAKPKK